MPVSKPESFEISSKVLKLHLSHYPLYNYGCGNLRFLIEILKESNFYLPDLENLIVGKETLNAFDVDSKEEAIKQIKERKYYERYLTENRDGETDLSVKSDYAD